MAGRAAVLVTRPEPGGAETAARVAALGWEVVVAPALVLAPRRLVIPPVQAVLLTSRAAARALRTPIAGIPVLAVGEATAEEARAQGWEASAAGGTARDLAELAASRLDPAGKPLLLAVGEGYAMDLAAELRAHGFRVFRRVAYAARPAERLPENAIGALAGGAVGRVLFHSPRSAVCAITLIRAAGIAAACRHMEVLAISPRVAEAAAAAIAPLSWRSLRIAARPDDDALMELLGRRAPEPSERDPITTGES